MSSLLTPKGWIDIPETPSCQSALTQKRSCVEEGAWYLRGTLLQRGEEPGGSSRQEGIAAGAFSSKFCMGLLTALL